MELNPYAAPQAQGSAIPPAMMLMYFRCAGLLGVRDGAQLPDVCVVTNQPADAKRWRKRRLFTWSPPWAWIGILGGLLPALILLVVTQKKANVTYTLSRPVRKRIVRRQLSALLLAFFSIGVTIVGVASLPDGYAGYMLIPLFIGIIVSLVIGVISNPLKVAKHRNGVFLIKGCSPGFLATLEEMPFPG